MPPDIAEKMRAGAAQSASGYGIPPNPMPSDTSPEDVGWATPRRLPQPLKAFATRLHLSAEISLPRSYIYCTKTGIGDTFGQFLERAQREGWRISRSTRATIRTSPIPTALLASCSEIAGT